MVRKKVSEAFLWLRCFVVVVWWSGVLDSVCALVGTALFNTTMRDWTVTTHPHPHPCFAEIPFEPVLLWELSSDTLCRRLKRTFKR